MTREEAADWLNPRNHYDAATLAGNEFGEAMRMGAEALRLVEKLEPYLEDCANYHREQSRALAKNDLSFWAKVHQLAGISFRKVLRSLQTGKLQWPIGIEMRRSILFRKFGGLS